MNKSPFFQLPKSNDSKLINSNESKDYQNTNIIFNENIDRKLKRNPSAPFVQSLTNNPSSQINYQYRPIDSFDSVLVPQNPSKFYTVPRSSRKKNLVNLPFSLTEDDEFRIMLSDYQITFNPISLGFIPKKNWEDSEISFGELYKSYFRSQENSNLRFYHKLYNALQISKSDPFYVPYLGVSWLDDYNLKVNVSQFSRLLGLIGSEIDLIGPSGKFASHGFIELNEKESLSCCKFENLEGIDYLSIKLFTHSLGIFIKNCNEEELEKCKWVNVRRRNSIHQ